MRGPAGDYRTAMRVSTSFARQDRLAALTFATEILENLSDFLKQFKLLCVYTLSGPELSALSPTNGRMGRAKGVLIPQILTV